MRSWQAICKEKSVRLKLEQAGSIAHEHRMSVKSEHLLLAIANSEPGIALEALENLGVCIGQLKEAILTQISSLPTGDRID